MKRASVEVSVETYKHTWQVRSQKVWGGSPYTKGTFWFATSNQPVIPSRYLKLSEGDRSLNPVSNWVTNTSKNIG